MARATNSRRFQRQAHDREKVNAKRERYAEAGPVTVTTADGVVSVLEPYEDNEQRRVIKGERVKQRPADLELAGEDTPDVPRP